jgi:hypothetical protein
MFRAEAKKIQERLPTECRRRLGRVMSGVQASLSIERTCGWRDEINRRTGTARELLFNSEEARQVEHQSGPTSGSAVRFGVSDRVIRSSRDSEMMK